MEASAPALVVPPGPLLPQARENALISPTAKGKNDIILTVSQSIFS